MEKEITIKIKVEHTEGWDYFEQMRLIVDEYLKEQIELLNSMMKKADNDENLKKNIISAHIENGYSSIYKYQHIDLYNNEYKRKKLIDNGYMKFFNELYDIDELPTLEDVDFEKIDSKSKEKRIRENLEEIKKLKENRDKEKLKMGE